LHVNPESDLEKLPLKATDYKSIFKSLLIPRRASTAKAEADNTSIRSLTHALTWVHRVYGEIFTDEENTLITVLENFLTVPIQFAVTSQQLANYTVAKNQMLLDLLGEFPLPNEMITTATGGTSTQRLVIKDWTGWTFIAADIAVLFIVLFGIGCILRSPDPLPTLTGLTELDILIEGSKMDCMRNENKMPLRNLPIVVGTESSPSYTKSLRQWRMRYVN
jgi:hypothetical protein